MARLAIKGPKHFVCRAIHTLLTQGLSFTVWSEKDGEASLTVKWISEDRAKTLEHILDSRRYASTTVRVLP